MKVGLYQNNFTSIIIRNNQQLYRRCILQPHSLRVTGIFPTASLQSNQRRLNSSASQSNSNNHNDKKGVNLSKNGLIRKLPNVLTLSRIACAPFIGNYILTSNLGPALYLFAYSCVTDFLDGYIARKYKVKTVSGTVLDPMADKILMVVGTASLTFAPGPQIIPISIATLILGRDVLLGLSAFYIRFTSMKRKYGNVTWSSFWDFFKFPSVEVKPTLVSKWNTFLQMIYISCAVMILILKQTMEKDSNINEEKNEFESRFRWIERSFQYFGYVVGITTTLSGASYIFSKSALRLV